MFKEIEKAMSESQELRIYDSGGRDKIVALFWDEKYEDGLELKNVCHAVDSEFYIILPLEELCQLEFRGHRLIHRDVWNDWIKKSSDPNSGVREIAIIRKDSVNVNISDLSEDALDFVVRLFEALNSKY